MTELEQLLKRDDIGANVSCGYTRLYYDNASAEWVVTTREGRRTRTLYRGPSRDSAIGWFNAWFDELNSQ